MEAMFDDLRFALRRMFKSPAFAVVVIITLAVGLGATTTVFSLVNWLVLRPIPGVSASRDLVAIRLRAPGDRRLDLTYPNFISLGQQLKSVTGLAASSAVPVMAAVPGEEPISLQAEFVTAGYFVLLGVRPVAGRTFLPPDDTTGVRSPVAIVSERLWREQLGGSTDVMGKAIRVNGRDFPIIGVAPASFHGIGRTGVTDVWVPAFSNYSILPFLRTFPNPIYQRGGHDGFGEVVGRLADGARVSDAEREVRLIMAALARTFREDSLFASASVVIRPGIGVPFASRAGLDTLFRTLSWVTGLVFLIATSNVINLLLFNGARRREEIAVRLALGASPARLVRQRVVDTVVLAVPAAALAVLLASLCAIMFENIQLPGLVQLDRIGVDWRVFGFASGLAVVTATAAGLTSAAMTVSRFRLGLNAPGRMTTPSRFRNMLGILQIAASLSLLVCAFLLIATLRNLRQVDLGMDPRQVSAMMPDPSQAGLDGQQGDAFFRETLARLAATPGVLSVTLSRVMPMQNFWLGNTAKTPSGMRTPVTELEVSPSYFVTLGIPLLRGRTFSDQDFLRQTGAGEQSAVLSGAAAKALFGDSDPLGQIFSQKSVYGGRLIDRTYRVIGIAQDSRFGDLVTDGGGPVVYRPLETTANGNANTFLIRSELPRQRVAAILRSIIRETYPGVPVKVATSLTENIDRLLSEERLFAKVIGLLAVLAATLASVGLYSLLSFGVAERTREFGIRMALGAEARRVLDEVARHGIWLATLGTAVGLAGAWAGSRLIASRLFGVTTLDPQAYLLSVAVQFLLVIVACLVPARAATRVDPIIALRSE